MASIILLSTTKSLKYPDSQEFDRFIDRLDEDNNETYKKVNQIYTQLNTDDVKDETELKNKCKDNKRALCL
jgi:hypothetical protein